MSEAGVISACSSCGGSVIWAKRADEPSRWSQLLEASSVRSGVFLDSEKIRKTPMCNECFTEHNGECM